MQANGYRWLRAIGYLEGVSAFVLFCIAMPMKYITQNIGKETFFAIGLTHGLLWMAYAIVATLALFQRQIGNREYWLLGLASLFPLGPIIADGWVLRRSGEPQPPTDAAIGQQAPR